MAESGQSATETTTLGSASAGFGLADNVGSVPLPHILLGLAPGERLGV